MGRLKPRTPSVRWCSIRTGNRVVALDRMTGAVSHVAVVDCPLWDTSVPVAEPNQELRESAAEDKGWIVTVFDNDTNTHLEVIAILMVATGCDAEEASIETWEIDNLGSSIVHRDSEQACQDAASVIATIGIRVEATPDPLC